VGGEYWVDLVRDEGMGCGRLRSGCWVLFGGRGCFGDAGPVEGIADCSG